MNLILLFISRKYRLGGILSTVMFIYPSLGASEQVDQIIHQYGNEKSSISGSSATSHWQPILIDARKRQIGILIGTTITHDAAGVSARAFEIVSGDGYLASIQPDGNLGGPGELYFETEDCSGSPYALVFNESDTANTFVPGHVFAFGKPLQLFAIARKTNTKKADIKSISRATTDGVTCVQESVTKTVYPVELNKVAETGIADTHFDGVTVQMEALETRRMTPEKNLPFGNLKKDRVEGTADIPVPPDDIPPALECSPGCEPGFLSDGVCEPECNNNSCRYDSGDCTQEQVDEAIETEKTQCAPACKSGDLGDGFCDEPCNHPACEYDQGDCEVTHDR